MSENLNVVIRYTNWRGETADRRIIPGRIYFGSNEWHPERQWLMDATDLDKGGRPDVRPGRDHAMADGVHIQ